MPSLSFLRNSLPSAAAAAAAMTGGVRSAALAPLAVARRWQSTTTTTTAPVAPKTSDTFGTGMGIFAPKDDTATSASSAVADQSSSPSPSYSPAGQSNAGFATTADPGLESTAHYLNAPRHQQHQQNAIDYYIMHVQASFNNTLVTITNHQGDAVAMSSGGKAGFKKANRAGYEPAYQATRQVLTKLETKLGDTAHTFGLHVKLKGFGPGRDAAWKCVLAHGWRVKAVEDVTPVAHGGCRPRKARRL